MKWKLAKQLLREFWLPALVASLWVAYGVWSDLTRSSISTSVTRFGAAFFFFSWLTSQIFRVSKQAKTEKSLSAIEDRILGVVDDLQRESAELRNVATGGDSFARLIIGLHTPASPTVFVSQEGKHPLYDVSARMVDLELFGGLPQPLTIANVATTETHITIGDMTPGYGQMANPIRPLSGLSRDYNIFFTGRNGGWTQQYCARLIGTAWLSATCVRRNLPNGSQGPVLLALRDAGYPDSDLPTSWPPDGNDVQPPSH
jgi:hypothetical protein